jgi:hypothetical protein
VNRRTNPSSPSKMPASLTRPVSLGNVGRCDLLCSMDPRWQADLPELEIDQVFEPGRIESESRIRQEARSCALTIKIGIRYPLTISNQSRAGR